MNQMVFMVCPHWIMTGDAGDHLASMGIENFRAYGMGKITLGFMALNADHIAICFEHCQVPAAMGFMTSGAFFDGRMLRDCLAVVAQGFTMTGITDQLLPVFEQRLVVAGMR
jgi:hypothetical protein